MIEEKNYSDKNRDYKKDKLFKKDKIGSSQFHNRAGDKILETLKMKKWDYVITQQVSYLSGDYASYYPFIIKLLNFVNSFR